MAVQVRLGLRLDGGVFPPPVGGLLPTMEAERRTPGEILRYYRRQKYSNLDRLAEKLETSKDVLSNYENDKVRPNHDTLLRLIAELDIPAVPLLRSMGYPLGAPKATYEELLAEDPLLDDDGRNYVRRALLHERNAAELRDRNARREPEKREEKRRRAV